MNTLKLFLLAAASIFSGASAHAQPMQGQSYKGYEMPRFEVLKQDGAFEVRDYASNLVAEVTVAGEREQAINAGFKILAGYIFGANTSNANIAMTSPVTQSAANPSEKIAMTSPVTQRPDGQNWVVQFTMPSQYTLQTLPKPKDERIVLRMAEKKRVAALKFSGFARQAAIEDNTEKLRAVMATQGLKAGSEPTLAYYDDPFTLPWNRRNEILIAIR